MSIITTSYYVLIRPNSASEQQTNKTHNVGYNTCILHYNNTCIHRTEAFVFIHNNKFTSITRAEWYK